MTAPVKERFLADLEAQYDAILGVVKAGLEAKRRVRHEMACRKCGKTSVQMVAIQDTDGAIKAASFLADHGLGKPGTVSEGDSAEPVTLVRQITFNGGGVDARLLLAELEAAGLLTDPAAAERIAANYDERGD